MINFKSEEDIKKVLVGFDVPELIFVGRKDAGPDEELYFFEDKDGGKYVVWARDYMSELEYEAEGLKNDFGIEVKEWVKLKDEDEYVAEFDGDSYAVFKSVEEK